MFKIKKIAFAGIVGLILVGCAQGTLVDANVVEDGLEYYIRIDKGVYDLGETIELLHRLTNVGGQTLNVCDLDIYTVSLELTRPEGDTLSYPFYYAGITPPMPPGLPDIITLNPGEYIERRYHITSLTWGSYAVPELVEEPFSTVGKYSIILKYNNSLPEAQGPLRLEPDALDFVIIPEPASIALLGLGLTSLLVRKKGETKCSN